MHVSARIGVIVSLCGLILSTSCSEDITADRTRFSVEEPFSIGVERKTRTTFSLEGVNGAVGVTGNPSASEITVSGVRRVESDSYEDAEAHLAELTVVIDSTDTEVLVRTVQPDDTGNRDYIVDYTITLPEDLVVEITNVNGEVTVQSLTGSVGVLCANGRIIGGVMEGDVDMRIGNGPIDTSVALPSGGRVELYASNGSIDLKIPQDTSAELTAKVANGGITVTDLTFSNKSETPKSFQGTLGDGDGVILLGVANGSIVIEGF
jgi:hypothetical protein